VWRAPLRSGESGCGESTEVGCALVPPARELVRPGVQRAPGQATPSLAPNSRTWTTSTSPSGTRRGSPHGSSNRCATSAAKSRSKLPEDGYDSAGFFLDRRRRRHDFVASMISDRKHAALRTARRRGKTPLQESVYSAGQVRDSPRPGLDSALRGVFPSVAYVAPLARFAVAARLRSEHGRQSDKVEISTLRARGTIRNEGFGIIWNLELRNEFQIQNSKFLIVQCTPGVLGVFDADQKPQRNSTAPTVNPAPTDASSTSWPFFRRPEQIASFSASGMVAAVVLPNRSMLMITLL
jgi:hypothetical protein